MDRATRYGSYVPVTTIGIAPIFGPETSRRRIRRLTCKVQPATSLGRIKGRYSPHDLVREHQDAPSALSSQGRLARSSQGRLARSGTALRFCGVKAVYRPHCSSRHLPGAREQQQLIPACPMAHEQEGTRVSHYPQRASKRGYRNITLRVLPTLAINIFDRRN